MLVIGHGGASAVAPPNTLRSFDAALHAGADMIEFDVRLRNRRLVLAHLPLPRLRYLTLDEALEHLGQARFDGIGLNVDIKAAGYERETVSALHDHGVSERTLVSSQSPAVIDRVRELDGSMQTAISVGGPVAQWLRSWSPRSWRFALVEALRPDRFGDIMLAHRLIDGDLVAELAAAGRRTFAWTVDDPDVFTRLCGTGVAGVVTGNPSALPR